jgi:DNA invertase Pin-like site-specific DNA recombinase
MKINLKNTHGGARAGSGRKRTPLNTRRMRVLREQGKSYRQIAEAFNVPTHIVSYYFQFILPKENNDQSK